MFTPLIRIVFAKGNMGEMNLRRHGVTLVYYIVVFINRQTIFVFVSLENIFLSFDIIEIVYWAYNDSSNYEHMITTML